MEATNRPEIPTALTLSQLSRYVAQAISREPVLLGTWVTAEISDLSSSGGHCYMTLIEKDPSGTTVARMRATIWASRYSYLRRKFLAATGRELANGMKVMLYGGVNYHGNYGLSFNVGEIDPSYTMGDLERIRREILATLQREGIIDRNRNLAINEPPQRIAIISSEKAAGYGDFINQLEHNSAGAVFYTLLFPAVMQGDRTAASVMTALDIVEQTAGIMQWDCVVIIRGGGATTDMNGFDDLELARRVATFPIPVAVGIGHERDRCVLDEIACVRCKTPTAVAAWLTDSAAIAWQRACDLTQRVATYAAERLKGEQIRLQGLEPMIPALAESQLKNANLRLHRISSALPGIAHEATSKEKIRLQNITTTLRIGSQARIDRERASIDSLIRTLTLAAGTRLEREHALLDSFEKLTEVLDPAYTLKRGYSITRAGGKAVTDPGILQQGEILETETAGGRILSKYITQERQTLSHDSDCNQRKDQ